MDKQAYEASVRRVLEKMAVAAMEPWGMPAAHGYWWNNLVRTDGNKIHQPLKDTQSSGTPVKPAEHPRNPYDDPGPLDPNVQYFADLGKTTGKTYAWHTPKTTQVNGVPKNIYNRLQGFSRDI